MLNETLLTRAMVVTRNESFVGTVHVRDGRIVDVQDSVSALPQAIDCGGDCLIGWQTIPGLPPEAPCKRPWCMRRVHGNCFCQPFYFTSQNTAYEGVPGCCAVDYEVRRLSAGRISRSAVSV